MSIYHCSIKIGSRTKGQSAVAASAYRSGEKLIDKETGLVSDYTRKSGVVFSEIALCKNAPLEYGNREILWNAVHNIEKSKNAQLWREFEVALPKELSRSEQIETVRAFVSKLTEQGMCIDWALHDKGDGNPHAHIMATMRSIEPNGKWAPKSRKVYDVDEKGERIFQKFDKTGRKQYRNHKEDYNNWNSKERVEEWRSAWADCCNAKLSERECIDHRSFDRQGINQIPTIHEGFVARKLVKNGKSSERIQINNDIRERNRQLLQIATQLKRTDEEMLRLSQFKEKNKIHSEVSTIHPTKKQWSEEEMQQLSKLKGRYIFQFCANECLKNISEVQYTKKNDYDESKIVANNFKEMVDKYAEIETQMKKFINPIKKIGLKKELAEQGKKVCEYADIVHKSLDVSLYYNSQKLSIENVTTEHLNTIYKRINHLMRQKKEAMETEKRNNDIYEDLKSKKISDESVNIAYKRFVSLVESVPDEQVERALKYIEKPIGKFSFETDSHNSKYRIKALKNIEKAINKLYDTVKRIKDTFNQPLFSKEKIMSDEFKPKSEKENNSYNYRSYGRGGR